MSPRTRKDLRVRLLCALGRQFSYGRIHGNNWAESVAPKPFARLRHVARKLDWRPIDRRGEPDSGFVDAAEHYVSAQSEADDWEPRLEPFLRELSVRNGADKLLRKLVSEGANPDCLAEILWPELGRKARSRRAPLTRQESPEVVKKARTLSKRFSDLAKDYEEFAKQAESRPGIGVGRQQALDMLRREEAWLKLKFPSLDRRRRIGTPQRVMVEVQQHLAFTIWEFRDTAVARLLAAIHSGTDQTPFTPENVEGRRRQWMDRIGGIEWQARRLYEQEIEKFPILDVFEIEAED